MSGDLPFPSLLTSGAHKKTDPEIEHVGTPPVVMRPGVPTQQLAQQQPSVAAGVNSSLKSRSNAASTSKIPQASASSLGGGLNTPEYKHQQSHNHGQSHGHNHGHSHGHGQAHNHGHQSHGHSSHGHSHGQSSHGHSHAPPPEQTSHLEELFGGLSVPKISKNTIRKYIRLMWSGKDSYKLMIYVVILLTMVCIKLLTGIFMLKTGVVASSFQSLFDIFTLLTSLLSMVWARGTTCFEYSYGYARFETLAGFMNSLFLCYTSFSLMIEATHSFYTPEEPMGSMEFKLEVLSMCANLIGLALFRKHMRLMLYGHSVHGFVANSQGAHDCNIHGVFIHALASFALRFSKILMYLWRDKMEDVTLMDFLCQVSACMLLIRLAYPLFRRTGNIMLQMTPVEISDALEQCVRKINTSDGVLECRYKHWWSQSSSETVGSVHVRVRADADEQAILALVTKQLKKYITNLTVQIEKDENLQNLLI